MLVKNHRRKIDWGRFEDIPDIDRLAVVRLSIILRLSVLLHRRRDSQHFDVKILTSESKIQLYLPQGLMLLLKCV